MRIRIRIGRCWPYPKFYICWKIGSTKFTFFKAIPGTGTSLQYFSFLVSGKGVRILGILDSILKFSRKKYKINVLGIETDPDRHALDTDNDPDPAKWWGSDPTGSTTLGNTRPPKTRNPLILQSTLLLVSKERKWLDAQEDLRAKKWTFKNPNCMAVAKTPISKRKANNISRLSFFFLSALRMCPCTLANYRQIM